MIERYTRPEMGAIWTDENKSIALLKVEMLACEAWAKIGEIQQENVSKLRSQADLNRIYEIEQKTLNDVVAFNGAVSETNTIDEQLKWAHYGLTPSDIEDSALSYLIKQANEILHNDLNILLQMIAKKAKEYKYTVCIGRTHGVHAEPTTFGLKLALCYEEIKRNIERFEAAAKVIETGKINGTVGTKVNIDPRVEAYICEKLGLTASISTQTLQRDCFVQYLSTLALIATAIEKFATEVRDLQKSGTREEERFAEGQNGSSTKLHEQSLIGSENMAEMAQLMRGYMMTACENPSLFHEHNFSQSSAGWVILPNTTIILDYMLSHFSNIIEYLSVSSENMKCTMDSQRFLLALIGKGLAREEAYETVQPLIERAWDERIPFRSLVEASKKITFFLSQKEIEDCFDYNYHIQIVDLIFERLEL